MEGQAPSFSAASPRPISAGLPVRALQRQADPLPRRRVAHVRQRQQQHGQTAAVQRGQPAGALGGGETTARRGAVGNRGLLLPHGRADRSVQPLQPLAATAIGLTTKLWGEHWGGQGTHWAAVHRCSERRRACHLHTREGAAHRCCCCCCCCPAVPLPPTCLHASSSQAAEGRCLQHASAHSRLENARPEVALCMRDCGRRETGCWPTRSPCSKPSLLLPDKSDKQTAVEILSTLRCTDDSYPLSRQCPLYPPPPHALTRHSPLWSSVQQFLGSRRLTFPFRK